MISVLVVTYNHSSSIDRALASIYRQAGIRRAEVIVADDASTDDTVARAGRWTSRLNIRILRSETNLGITGNYQRAFAAVRGDLIAVLEGDDEWSDRKRLQKLRKVMRDRRLTMCGNRSLMITEGSSDATVLPFELARARRYSAEDLASGNAFSTFSACMYRTSAVHSIDPEVFALKAYDWLVNLVVAEQGGALLVPDVMTTYHRHANGVWSRMTQRERDQEVIDLIPGYTKVVRSSVADRLLRLRATMIESLRE